MVNDGKLQDGAEIVKGIAENIPVYKDAVQPVAKQAGKALETIGKTVNAALLPLKGLVWGADRLEEFFATNIAQKLEQTPNEDIITPAANVAGPTIEALRFTGNIPLLREMYANLLAASMDIATAPTVHPCFVEMIRQLTPDEAKLIPLFAKAMVFPVISLRIKRKDDKGGQNYLNHFSLIGYEADCEYPEAAPQYIDNLLRLGFITEPPFYKLTDDSIYEPLENHEFIKYHLEKIRSSNYESTIVYGSIQITELGDNFLVVCVGPHDELRNKSETKRNSAEH